MMISGYVSALSFQRRGIDSYDKAYGRVRLAEQIVRYTVPYTIAFAAEWIVFRVYKVYTVGIRTYGILALMFDFLRGGKGQGSYYFPVMIQFIFIFPLIYFAIRKYNLKGLFYCFLANALFEVLKTAYGMNDVEYRLLVFRYLFVIAAGSYIAIGEIQKDYKTVILCIMSMIVGLFFIYLFSYTNYNPKIIVYWKGTSFLVCLYIIPILGLLLRKVHCRCQPLEIIGKASFNIFLVQMIYYNFAGHMYEMIPNRLAQLIFNIVNCVVAGIIFYYIEYPITKIIIKRMKKLQISEKF